MNHGGTFHIALRELLCWPS